MRLLAAGRGGGARVDAQFLQVQICHHRSHLHSTAAAVSAARWLQQPWRRREWSALAGRQRQHSRSGRRRAAAASPQAMVNVDFSPALVLGLGMVAGGVLLYNVRVNRPWISRDYDVVISSVSVLVGGILVFQGWRLDPLLLFGQLLTAGTATAFALEVFRLRETLAVKEGRVEDEGEGGRWMPLQTGGRGSLPQPEDERQFQQWSGAKQQQQQDRWPATYSGAQEDDYAADDLYSVPQERQGAAEFSGSGDDEPGGGRGDDGSGRRGGPGSGRSGGWGRAVDYDAVEDW